MQKAKEIDTKISKEAYAAYVLKCKELGLKPSSKKSLSKEVSFIESA